MDETLLRFGDVVRLKLADRSRALYVRGEGHVLASVVAIESAAREGDDGDFLFQVVPALSYKAAAQKSSLEARHRREQKPPGGAAASSPAGPSGGPPRIQRDSSFDQLDRRVKTHEELVQAEARKNERTLRELAEDGARPPDIQFLDCLQLRHVKTGKYVTYNARGHRLELSAGSSLSIVRVMPRQKFHEAGDAVQFNDDVWFESQELEEQIIALRRGGAAGGSNGGVSLWPTS